MAREQVRYGMWADGSINVEAQMDCDKDDDRRINLVVGETSRALTVQDAKELIKDLQSAIKDVVY